MDQLKIRSDGKRDGVKRYTRQKERPLIAQAQDKSSKRSYRLAQKTKKKIGEKKNKTTIPIMQKAREKEAERQHLKERAIYTHGHWLDRAFDDHHKNKKK